MRIIDDTLKTISSSYAKEYCSDAIYPAHLFKAVLHKEIGLVHFIETELDKDYYYLQEWADVQMSLLPRATRPVYDLELSSEAEAVIEEADDYKVRFGKNECDAVCVMASLVTPGVGFTFEQLKTLPLTSAEICTKIGMTSEVVPGMTGNIANQGPAPLVKGMIGKYCINKIAEACSGKIEPVIGFEKEISTIYEILGRKTKSNLLITGEAGVGKTSLINGFVIQLANKRVPVFLNNAVAYELDTAALAADASYKGETEDRFKKVIQEIEEQESAVLIIESVDKFFDKQSSLYGVSSILKQELSKGRLLLLCTSSIDGYTKYIETDKEFVTKIEKVTVEEPNADICLRILKGALSAYETFHHLTVDEEVMTDAVRLAKRYLTEKALPDSAFDLIDRTLSLLKTMNDVTETDIAEFQTRLDELAASAEEKDASNHILMKELEWLNYEIWNKINCILLAQLDSDTDFGKIPTILERIDYLRCTLYSLAKLSTEKRVALKSADLYAVVAKQTGIPLGKVQVKERDRLLGAEDTLKKRVVGQDHAIKKVLDAVFESRSGLNKKGQPMGSFFSSVLPVQVRLNCPRH